MRRAFLLLGLQLRTSALMAAQYRWDFVTDAVISMLWTATSIVPLFVVYGADRHGVPGWSCGEALLVTGWFILLQGVLEGAVNPSLTAVVEHIRKGTLDFVLLKPFDAQFLVSTTRFQLWKVSSLAVAFTVFVVAFRELGRLPSLAGVAMAVLMLGVAVWLLYSLWILIVSLAFYVVKVDNLTYLFGSIFDAARWPSSVFRGLLGWVFTFVVPLSLMTTYPAEALLGRLEVWRLGLAVLGACAFAFASRAVWLRSISHYSSAGG
jgi:ABC-2 type transport system permease protein